MRGVYVCLCGGGRASTTAHDRRRRGEATALMDAIDVPLTFGLREMRRRLREKDGKAREGVVGDGGPGREGADAVARLDEILRERCPFCGEV